MANATATRMPAASDHSPICWARLLIKAGRHQKEFCVNWINPECECWQQHRQREAAGYCKVWRLGSVKIPQCFGEAVQGKGNDHFTNAHFLASHSLFPAIHLRQMLCLYACSPRQTHLSWAVISYAPVLCKAQFYVKLSHTSLFHTIVFRLLWSDLGPALSSILRQPVPILPPSS